MATHLEALDQRWQALGHLCPGLGLHQAEGIAEDGWGEELDEQADLQGGVERVWRWRGGES